MERDANRSLSVAAPTHWRDMDSDIGFVRFDWGKGHFSPVAEFVGWTVLNGKESVVFSPTFVQIQEAGRRYHHQRQSRRASLVRPAQRPICRLWPSPYRPGMVQRHFPVRIPPGFLTLRLCDFARDKKFPKLARRPKGAKEKTSPHARSLCQHRH